MIDKAHAKGMICNLFWSDDAEEAKEIIERAIEESSIYDGNNIVIIGGDSYSYGNDENEVIVEEAEVIEIA